MATVYPRRRCGGLCRERFARKVWEAASGSVDDCGLSLSGSFNRFHSLVSGVFLKEPHMSEDIAAQRDARLSLCFSVGIILYTLLAGAFVLREVVDNPQLRDKQQHSWKCDNEDDKMFGIWLRKRRDD